MFFFWEMKSVFNKISFKWRPQYFIWKIRCSANFWHFYQCFKGSNHSHLSACWSKLDKLRKTYAISPFYQNFLILFPLWKISKIGFFFHLIIHSFREQILFARMRRPKNRWALLETSLCLFYQPQQIGNCIKKEN